MAGSRVMEQVIAISGRVDPSLNRAIAQADKAMAKTTKQASAVSKAAKAVGTAALAGATAAAAGTAALAKKALDNYASYEQLVGGVETLFKNQSDLVVRNAKNAYQTAGMDANTYMETVTSFSAALINSLDNDTAKAAQYSQMAISDMADNANKMGSSIESIQGTYQSLSRGNYAMLDNLKLGYGGTKTELQRLLSDAEKYKAANGEVASYSIDSYADIVEAIHVVQDEMGITGTTAKEASETIEGSVNAAKAQWQNWLRALGEDDAELGEETEALVETVATAAKNIVPRLAKILSSVFQTMPELLPQVLAELGQSMGTLLVDTLGNLFGEAGTEAGNQLVDALGSTFGAAGDVIGSLQQIVSSALLPLLPIIGTVLSSVSELAPVFARVFGVVANVVSSALGAVMPIIAELVDALLPCAIQVIQSTMPIIEQVGLITMQLVSALAPLLSQVAQLVGALLPPIATLISAALQVIGPILELLSPVLTVIEGIANVLGTIIGFVTDIVNKAGSVIGFLGELVGIGGGGGAEGFATGGFTRGLSIAGEDPRYPVEAVISFNPAYRAQNLRYWQMAGSMLGANQRIAACYAEGGFTNTTLSAVGSSLGEVGYTISGSGEVNKVYDLSGLSFSPQITVQGGSVDADDIVERLREAEPEFRDFILSVLEEWDEVAYD